jgi:hypothetical protein
MRCISVEIFRADHSGLVFGLVCDFCYSGGVDFFEDDEG